MLKRFVSLAVAAAALFGYSVVTTPSAYAASCYGGSCSNKGPQGTGCESGSYNLQSFGLKGGFYQLRWSPACHAGWVRTSGAGAAGARGVIQRVLLDGGGDISVQEQRSVSVNGGETDWSNMVGTNYDSYYRICGTYFGFPDSSLDCGPLFYK
ncbi:hypothetical protein OG883_17250 [Streptomyces sp. NBC_01142]|uniref:hypothetical protein n=1 Tax=Streptomyces sp. NBC_01142 TaxID=2975865 RepID=UPI00224E9F5A|nr:hypothetical protein [Streptomyces sp. NBC_01142]MCX4821605.1 hypothetical protein [Streptomyces sp. NBC_01142]